MNEANKNIITYILAILAVNGVCAYLEYSSTELKVIIIFHIFFGLYQLIDLIPKIVREIKKKYDN
jgi:hypothetical protein